MASELDRDDSTDDVEAEDRHHDRGHGRDLSKRPVDERIQMRGVHEEQEEEDPNRDERDDPAGELALGRQNLDHAADVHARPDVGRYLVENLSGVTACLSLNQRKHGSEVGVCGGDPVSPEAAGAFNERINALVMDCRSYNRELRAAANALDATAKSYGYTEDEIAASYRPGS